MTPWPEKYSRRRSSRFASPKKCAIDRRTTATLWFLTSVTVSNCPTSAAQDTGELAHIDVGRRQTRQPLVVVLAVADDES
jgi:hypothetical protein